MTDAQRAHIRILESTPRERIRTHEAALPPTHKGRRIPAELSQRRRRWIAEHANKYTNMEMALHLSISPTSVKKHLVVLGLAVTRKGRGRPRKIRV